MSGQQQYAGAGMGFIFGDNIAFTAGSASGGDDPKKPFGGGQDNNSGHRLEVADPGVDQVSQDSEDTAPAAQHSFGLRTSNWTKEVEAAVAAEDAVMQGVPAVEEAMPSQQEASSHSGASNNKRNRNSRNRKNRQRNNGGGQGDDSNSVLAHPAANESKTVPEGPQLLPFGQVTSYMNMSKRRQTFGLSGASGVKGAAIGNFTSGDRTWTAGPNATPQSVAQQFKMMQSMNPDREMMMVISPSNKIKQSAHMKRPYLGSNYKPNKKPRLQDTTPAPVVRPVDPAKMFSRGPPKIMVVEEPQAFENIEGGDADVDEPMSADEPRDSEEAKRPTVEHPGPLAPTVSDQSSFAGPLAMLSLGELTWNLDRAKADLSVSRTTAHAQARKLQEAQDASQNAQDALQKTQDAVQAQERSLDEANAEIREMEGVAKTLGTAIQLAQDVKAASANQLGQYLQSYN